MRIPWIGHSATAKSSNVSSLECINMYAETTQSQQGKTTVALYPTPGLVPALTVAGTVNLRALHTDSRGRLFAVRGATVSEVFANHTSVVVGTLATPIGPVRMADNGLALMLVDGIAGYTYTYSTGVFAQIVDLDFLGGTHIGFLDGYFVLLPPGQTQTFYWSDLYAETFTGSNIASAEGNPDILVALLVVHREVWLFGRVTTEVWYSTGQAGADAFARLEGALLEYGCLASQSPAIVGDTLCWLAQNTQGDRVVVQAIGMSVQPISTHTMQQELRTYTRLDNASGWGYQSEGHVFYWLHFPTATPLGGVTWVYDLTSGLWHKRSYHQVTTGYDLAHLAACYASAFGRHYVGSAVDGMVYVLDEDTYTDAGTPILREAILPPVSDAASLQPVPHNRLQLDVEAGVGLTAGVVPGTDPQLELSYSDDGAHTWRGFRSVSLGRQGAYRHKVVFRRLGSAEDRRYRVRFSSPCKLVILGAVLN